MARVLGLRRWVMVITDDWEVDWPYDAAQWVICRAFGHDPAMDQCGRPEHDFCLWCRKLMPGRASRRVVSDVD